MQTNEWRLSGGPTEIQRLLLFGPIARCNWIFSTSGKAQIEGFLDARPLFQLLQGRRVEDWLLADDDLAFCNMDIETTKASTGDSW